MQVTDCRLAVIVPAYNVESYIKQCLESLLSQYDPELKIVIVDDGSTDSTGVLCDFYARQWPERITLIHQPNRGLGAARNTGLAVSHARYVTFLDADDWYPSQWVSTVMEQLRAHDGCDVFFTMPQLYDMNDGSILPWYDKDMLHQIFDGQDVVNVQTDSRLFGLQPSCCARVFRRDFLSELEFRFPENTLWEDIFPHFFLLDHAVNCRLIDQTGFIYRRGRPGQITASPTACGEDLCAAYRKILYYANSNGWSEEKTQYVHKRIVEYVFWRCRISDRATRANLIRAMHTVSRQISQAQRRALQRVEVGSGRKKIMLWLMTSEMYNITKYLYEIKKLLQPIIGIIS